MKPELAAGYKFWRFLFVGARADVAWVEQLSSKELDGQSNLLGSAWSAGAIVGLVFTRIHLLAHFDPLGRYYPSNPTVQTQSLSFENPQAYGVSARYHFTDSFFLGTEYFKTTYRRIRVRSGDAPEGESSYSADTQIRFWSAGITFGATL